MRKTTDYVYCHRFYGTDTEMCVAGRSCFLRVKVKLVGLFRNVSV